MAPKQNARSPSETVYNMAIGELTDLDLSKTRGFFIDLDGTLADTMESFYNTYATMVTTMGGEASQEEFQQLVGATLDEIVGYLRDTYKVELPHKMLLDQYHQFIGATYEKAELFPGAAEFFEAAKERSLPCWVVTSAPKHLALKFLEAKGLDKQIQGIIGCDEISHGKPHPEIYQMALELAELDPSSILVIEDSLSGITAALEADLPTVMILQNGDCAPDWEFPALQPLGYVRSWEPIIQAIRP